jgi:putative membrane protein
MKVLKLIPPFIYGAIFGITNVIPGVSTGTMMVVFGCYDIVCGALALDFKHIRKHILFLLPFGFGAVAGLGGAVYAIAGFIERHPIPTYLFFIGLIIGSLPMIWKKLKAGRDFKKPEVRYALLVPGIIALAIILELTLQTGEAPEAAETAVQLTLLYGLRLFFGSVVAAAALIIPGISGAFILLLFGIYPVITGAARNLIGGGAVMTDFIILLIAGSGIILGVVFGARLIKWLLERHHTMVYSIIAGLMLGSIFMLFPAGAGLNATLAVGVCAFVIGVAIPVVAGRKGV